MNKRPRSITVISWIFIAIGVFALLYHLRPPFEEGLIWICLVRMLAIVCGAFMLYGFNWARWLLVVWIGCHVIVGALHSPSSLLVHGFLFAVVAYFLFRPQASAYFRGAKTQPPQIPKTDDKPMV
jgi:uncharacterized membrane protein HdeD (DUF308 family)